MSCLFLLGSDASAVAALLRRTVAIASTHAIMR